MLPNQEAAFCSERVNGTMRATFWSRMTFTCLALGLALLSCMSSAQTEDYPDCGLILLNGNGNCEATNNNADCGYDGGDCCECTCVDETFTCGGLMGYDCQDPTTDCAASSTDDDEYPNCGSTWLIGNGNCEVMNNNADCGYDGGDCCPCTCVDGTVFTCGGVAGYDCQDPSANCSMSTSDENDDSNCGSALLTRNGNCDLVGNNAECDYDGGDCCPCTCVDGTVFTCGGLLGYDCQDPSANCSTTTTTFTSDEEYPNCGAAFLNGNGNCEATNNNADCGYDGGDCCPCTCVDGTVFTCGGLLGYDCQDPSASCATSTSDEEYPNCLVSAFNGNGNCDVTNNNADCGYDGGDCCPCTCIDGPIFTCGFFGYNCQDPSADCPTSTSDDEYLKCGLISVFNGNGNCDPTNNNANCGYDGGDCCPCTCVDGPIFTCGGLLGYNCQDPSAGCVGDTEADPSSISTRNNRLKTQASIVTAAVLPCAALLLLLVGYCHV